MKTEESNPCKLN